MTILPDVQIPIVLTATLRPQGAPSTADQVAQRLREYTRVASHCLQFSRVYFLENSDYKFDGNFFGNIGPRFSLRRFPPSPFPERGKGYQEFEMLDAWLKSEENPPDLWLKMSGRYQILNLESILEECRRETQAGIIIDQAARPRMARTYVFRAQTSFYRRNVQGLYQQCDDRTGAWIERILFQALKGRAPEAVHTFARQPQIRATAGSSGTPFQSGRLSWSVKQTLRSLNRLVDRQYLWYSN